MALVTLAMLALACTEKPDEVRETASGASIHRLLTADGIELDARLWVTHPERIVIYLHEFRDDQTSWWPYARQRRAYPSSSLTIDFRGHGESTGEVDDVAGMLLDVEAAIEFARLRGYSQFILVGAGMGGAVAVAAAMEHPNLTVIGFSVPSDFDVFSPLAMAPELRDRVAFFASREDLSAAHALELFRDQAGIHESRAREYPGRAHGVDMLSGRAGADVRAYFEGLLNTFWQRPQTSTSAN